MKSSRVRSALLKVESILTSIRWWRRTPAPKLGNSGLGACAEPAVTVPRWLVASRSVNSSKSSKTCVQHVRQAACLRMSSFEPAEVMEALIFSRMVTQCASGQSCL